MYTGKKLITSNANASLMTTMAKVMTIKKGEPVYIAWEDSSSRNGWLFIDEVDFSLSLINSIGYVVENGKKYITISTSKDDDGKIAMDALTIPKSAIRKISMVKAQARKGNARK
jgi:hypothetical protein